MYTFHMYANSTHAHTCIYIRIYAVYMHTAFACTCYACLQADAYVTCDTYNFEKIHCIMYLYVIYEM